MELQATQRDLARKARNLRKEGILPAVIYGRKEASAPISINHKDFEKLYKAAGESTVITLKGLGEDKDVLINDVEIDAVSGKAVHADFYAIEKGQTVTVTVPFEFEGISPAVKDLGAILVKVMHDLELTVLPKDLPHSIVVDVSKLKEIGDQIAIKDLKIPPSAELSIDAEEVVAMVTLPKEESDEPAAPIDLSAIETSVERGKKDDEEATPDAE
jgi:large subunit ribosomal protein L25